MEAMDSQEQKTSISQTVNSLLRQEVPPILWLANCCFGHNSLGFRRPATIL